MNRRGFLQAMLAAAVAPAFVRGGMGILMPVQKVWLPVGEMVSVCTVNPVDELVYGHDVMVARVIEEMATRARVAAEMMHPSLARCRTRLKGYVNCWPEPNVIGRVYSAEFEILA